MSNKLEVSPISRLPDEMVLEIFSYIDIYSLLETVAHVCTRWKRISKTNRLWRNPLYSATGSCPDKMAALICSPTWKEHMRCIQTFVFRPKTAYIVDNLLHMLGRVCPKLSKLEIIGQQVLHDFLVNALFYCGSVLQELNLEGTMGNNTLILTSFNTLFGPIANLLKLHTLYVNGCNWTNKAFVNSLLQSGQKLTHLSIETDGGSVASVQCLVKKHSNYLKELTISGTLTDSLLKTISVISTLQSLSLAENGGRANGIKFNEKLLSRHEQKKYLKPEHVSTSEGWVSFGDNFHNLRHLSLSGHSSLEGKVIKRIANVCAELECIAIDDCDRVTNVSISSVISRCYMLKTIELKRLRLVDSFALKKFINAASLPNLTTCILK